MTHLPVEKWAAPPRTRLIDARFVKPVYDGEVAELTGSESGGILSIEVHSRGGSAPPHGVVAVFRAGISLAEFREIAPVASAIRSMPAPRVGNGSARSRATAGDAAKEYLADIRENRSDRTHAKASAIPAVAAGDEQVLVDNAVPGPVDSRGSKMQLLSAAKAGDVITARAKVTAITTRKAISSSNSTRWSSPTARRRWAHCHHFRFTSHANSSGLISCPSPSIYYVSLNSPWTYLGQRAVRRVARRHGANCQREASKFGPIFEQTGGLPLPKRSPQRRLPPDGF